MPLNYRTTLALLQRSAERAALYTAADESGDLCEVWRAPDGREWVIEAVCAGEACRLYRPVPLVTAEQLRRELVGAPAVRR